MVRVCQIQLGETLGTAVAVKRVANQRQRVLAFDGQVIETLIIDAQLKATIFPAHEQY